MRNRTLLEPEQCDATLALAKKEENGVSVMSIEALQRNLHKDAYRLRSQDVVEIWDQMSAFVRACWS